MKGSVVTARRHMWTRGSAMRVASQLLVSVALFLLLQFFLVFRASTSIRGLSSDGPVCFVTGDVLLVSKSRGTADGFSQLIASLSSRGVAVHVVLLAEDAVDCVNSGNAIQDSLKGVTSSCAQLDATAPLSAATTTLRHWATRSLPRTCRTVVTHDFWAPATLLFTERLLWPQRRHPSLVTNFMGGALWSSSWDVNRTTTYSDWMMDYDERMGGWAADFLVFSNEYHQAFHAARWTLRGRQFIGHNINREYLVRRTTAGGASTPHQVKGLAFVARVDKRKGIAELVQCLLALSDVPLIRVHIIGSLGLVNGVPADKFVNAALAGVASRVEHTIHGAMPPDAVWRFVKQHELLLVSPSLLENEPTTIPYAAAMDIPTLYYATGGVRAMIAPDSQPRVLLDPDVGQLTARVRECVTRGYGYAPVLSERLFEAEDKWMAILGQATRLTIPHIERPPNAPPPPVTDVVLSPSTSVGDVASRLPVTNASIVLLRHPSYAPLADSEHWAAALHALHENGGVAGLAGGALSASGAALDPAGPFFFPSRDWTACGPEAPVLVRAGLLRRYAAGVRADLSFRAWAFTAWAIYHARAAILKVPYPLYAFSGCFNLLDCFSAEDAVPSLAALVTRPSLPEDMQLPTLARDAYLRLAANFSERVAAACAGRVHAPAWWAAAASPQLCAGSVEHGSFNLRALHAALGFAPMCGASCVLNLGNAGGGARSPAGWHLDWDNACWNEVASDFPPCVKWFVAQQKHLPAGLACHVGPRSVGAATPTVNASLYPHCAAADEFAAGLQPLCAPNAGDPWSVAWAAAARVPRLCNGTAQHGFFNANSLAAALRACCNCGCVFLGTDLPAPPSSALGFGLNVADSCWGALNSANGCAIEQWPSRPRGPVAVSCDQQPAEGVTCDLLLSPEEYPPKGFCGPKVLLAGVSRCGTNFVANVLHAHPLVSVKLAEAWEFSGNRSMFYTGLRDDGGHFFEAHFFTYRFLKSRHADPTSLDARHAYARLLPKLVPPHVTFDRSTSYFDNMYHPDTPRLIKQLLPNAKIVVAVCDPVPRLWSQYSSEEAESARAGAPTPAVRTLRAANITSFEQLVASFDAGYDNGTDVTARRWAEQEFLEKGYYALHLLDYFTVFGRSNVHVVNTHELRGDGNRVAKTVEELLAFLDLPADSYLWDTLGALLKADEAAAPGFDRHAVPLVPAVRLRALYKKHNEMLQMLVGVKF